VADSKLLIPSLLIDGTSIVSLTLQLSNPTKSEGSYCVLRTYFWL
jgi:hypothetical protein